MKGKRKLFGRRLIRPILYMTFTRAALGLAGALLWDHFTRDQSARPMRLYAFIALAALFLALGWMAYLRLDGVRLPAPDRRLFEWRKRPVRAYGDMSDHTDEDVFSYDDLEDGERDFCRMAADVVCGVVFASLSFL